MSTITRERLFERAREKVKGLEFAVTQAAFADSREELEEELELARIALASLEAEAVAVITISHGGYDKGEKVINYFQSEIQYLPEGQMLYAAPPAPSVDEDLLHMAASAIDDLLSNKDRSGAGVWADIPAKLRRAAMLQGADDNSQVVPDGWVIVPVEPTMSQEFAGYRTLTDTGKMSRLMKTRLSNIYRAMVAAAPQQEVK